MGDDRRRVRGWHFWRARFWTRPALLVCYAPLVAALAVVVFGGTLAAAGQAAAMERAPLCRTEHDDGCLETRAGWLSERYARGPGSRWQLYSSTLGAADVSATVSPVGSGALREYDGTTAVLGLYWNEELVAFQLPGGRVVESRAFGHRAWVWEGSAGLFVLASVPGLVAGALEKRRAGAGWWSTTAPPAPAVPQSSALTSAAALIGVPAVLPFFVVVFGGSVSWAVGGYAASAVAVVWLLHRARRRAPAAGSPRDTEPEAE